MKFIFRILICLLFPFMLSAALPPTAQDLREVRAIVDSPVLSQLLSPDDSVSSIWLIDYSRTEPRSEHAYVLESTSLLIGVLVNYVPDESKPGLVGPLPIKLQFYVIKKETPHFVKDSYFEEIFGSSEPIVVDEKGAPSQVADLVRIRAILASPDLYSELSGRRFNDILKGSPMRSLEQVRDDMAAEQSLDEKETKLKDALDKASMEKSDYYVISTRHQGESGVEWVSTIAFVLYPEGSEQSQPTIIFYQPPNYQPPKE